MSGGNGGKAKKSARDYKNAKRMSRSEVAEALASRPLWELSSSSSSSSSSKSKQADKLVRGFAARDFAAAQAFLAAVGAVAEALGHHPDLHLEAYRNVRVELYTHSAGGVTALDLELADAIDADVAPPA